MSGLYPWVPLGLLFLAPFVDPRRPFRVLHLDLVVMLGFSAILLSSVERGFPGPSRDLFAVGTVLVALGLLYLVARMLFEGRRLRDRREPLIPYLPIAWLAVAVALLVCFRIGYTLLDPIGISDVGGAGVIGADEIAEGIRASAHTIYHPVATCALGRVVDADLRVRGLEGLRVADASVIPQLVRGHTHAATTVVAERAADLITAGF